MNFNEKYLPYYQAEAWYNQTLQQNTIADASKIIGMTTNDKT